MFEWEFKSYFLLQVFFQVLFVLFDDWNNVTRHDVTLRKFSFSFKKILNSPCLLICNVAFKIIDFFCSFAVNYICTFFIARRVSRSLLVRVWQTNVILMKYYLQKNYCRRVMACVISAFILCTKQGLFFFRSYHAMFES